MTGPEGNKFIFEYLSLLMDLEVIYPIMTFVSINLNI